MNEDGFEFVNADVAPRHTPETFDTDSFARKFAEECSLQGRDDIKIIFVPGEGFVARAMPEVVVPGQMVKIRDDQVQNNAGGYVFAVSDDTRIRRFLILGTTGGTYYTGEKELTMQNVKALTAIIDKGKGFRILEELEEISLAGRNPKQGPVMFALALCARYRVGDLNEKHESAAIAQSESFSNVYSKYLHSLHTRALQLIETVCRIPTHLFMFIKYSELVAKTTTSNGKSTGWGRGLRKAICEWYYKKSPEQLAMAVTKYGKREGWSHRDLFRLAHPSPKVKFGNEDSLLEFEQIYRYIIKGELATRKRLLNDEEKSVEQPETKYSKVQMDNELNSKALTFIETFKSLNKQTPEEEIVKAIIEKGLVREHIPSEHLNSVAVWEALLHKMPMTALVRNLSKMQSIGMIKGDKVPEVCAKITNEEAIRTSRIHPMTILIAKCQYERGHGLRGKLKWKPNKEINQALEKAFYTSFINCEPTGKRFLYAFDVSGSMHDNVLGSSISCRTASVAMGMIGMKKEEEVDVVVFSDGLIEISFIKDWPMHKIMEHIENIDFGCTDCSLPMVWATKEKKEFDVFVVFTDNETYYGEVHPFVALQQYRESSGIKDARLIVMGMRATNFSIADPNDAGMMDIAGFDSAVPELISNFVLGRI